MSGKIKHYKADLISVFAELMKEDMQKMVGQELVDATLRCDSELTKKKRHMKKSKYWKGKK